VVALATVLCFAVTIGLLWLDREPKVQISPAMWIVQAWFFLACSRPVARWLGIDDAQGTVTAVLSEGSPLDRAVGTVLLLFGLIVLLNRRRAVTIILRKNWPIVLFFAYCLVSLLWSDFPLVAVKRWVRAIGDLVMVLVVWTDARPFEAFKRLLARSAYSLIPLSILLIKYYPSLGRVYGLFLGEVGYTGVTGGKNELGAICMLFGAATVWRILDLLSSKHQAPRRIRQMVVQLTVISMIVWLLWMADSMTSLSCFVLATCVLCCLRLRLFDRNRLAVHTFAFVTVLIPASVALLGASPSLLQAMGRNPTLTDRTLIWTEVIKLVPNQWVGSGYQSFWLGPRLETMITNITHWWVPNQAHNGYLEIFANLGWIGVGLLALVIVWGYCRVIRAYRRDITVTHLLLAYTMVGLVSNITEASFFRMAMPVWLFFMLAIMAPSASGTGRFNSIIRSDLAIRQRNQAVIADDVLQAL
jgi:exopolysaccharide production protein ExoQ